MRKSVKYGLVGVFVACIAVAGIAVAAWRILGLGYVEGLIVETLADRGVPVSALTLRSVGLERAELVDLRFDLAGGVSIRRVEAEYRLADLIWERRIDRLLLSGLRVDLAPTAEPSSADTMLPDARPVDLPIGRIVVQDGEIAIATPVGPATLAVDLEAATLAEGGVTVSGRARMPGDSGEIGMPFAGDLSPEGEYGLTATMDAGRLRWRGAVLDNPEGSFTFSGTGPDVNRVETALAADLTMPDGSAARLHALGQLADGSGDFSLELIAGAGQGRVGLNAAARGWGQPSVAYELKLDGEMPLLGRVAEMAGADIDWVSAGMVTAGLSGTWNRVAGNAQAPVDGRLVAQADLRSADAGRVFTMDLAVDLRVGAGTARLRTDRSARLSWQPDRAAGALALTLGGRSDGAFDVSLGRAGAGWTLAAGGPFQLADGDGSLSGSVDLTASGDRTPAGQAGRLSVDLAASGSVFGAMAVDRGHASLAGTFSVGDGRWRLQSDSCQTVAVERLTIGPHLSLPNGFSGCLSALPDRPLLEAAASGMDVTVAARTDPAAVLIDTGAAEGLRIELGRMETTVTSRLDADGTLSAGMSVPVAELRLPNDGIALDGVALALETAAGAEPALRLSLDSAILRSLRDPAWIVPLRISGDAVFRDDDPVEFQADVRGAAGALAAAVNGRHDRISGVGRARIRLDPVSFAPGVRQPVDVAPALDAGSVGDVVGGIAADAWIDWGERISSGGEIRVENLMLTRDGATVRGIDGTLFADSLFPPNLPDGQLLSLGGADVGLALEEGAVAFGLAGDRLSVQGIGFSLAGGSLAVGPFEISPGDREVAMEVTMQGIELAELSRQFPVEGLTVTGRLDGEIPVRLTDDTISIDNGVVETTESGVIQYVVPLPTGAEDEAGIGLLIGAVRNFHYEGLRATLNGRTGEDLEVAVRLTGANPDLYDGYPIALNINLTGALDQILRSGLRSMSIADEAGSLLRDE